jgi:DNA-binding transcriptional regulator YhcF (GntR family)
MKFIFDDDKPIYKQLVEQLKIMIVNNVYKKGEKLPSVRDFAISIKVNPNTIQRALSELEDDGLIITQRTSGKFVTEDELIIKNLKNSLAHETIEKFLLDISKLDISTEELIELIRSEGKDK